MCVVLYSLFLYFSFDEFGVRYRVRFSIRRLFINSSVCYELGFRIYVRNIVMINSDGVGYCVKCFLYVNLLIFRILKVIFE